MRVGTGNAIAYAGGIQPLVTLLKQGSQKAQRGAAAALASISEDSEHQRNIIKAGALVPLVRLLRVGIADAQVRSRRQPYATKLPRSRAAGQLNSTQMTHPPTPTATVNSLRSCGG